MYSLTLRFEKNETELICEYSPEGGTDYIYNQLKDHESLTIKRVFNIKKKNIIESDEFFLEDKIHFIIGRKRHGYYVLDNEILELTHVFYLYENMSIDRKTFLSHRGISILNKLDLHTTEDIFIGGDRATIPEQEFYRLIDSFPNTNELNKYADMRISSIVKDYVAEAKDYIDDYEKYMNKKITKSFSLEEEKEEERIFENEFQKFLYIRNKLQRMLRDEEQYSEKDWQNEIAKILTLIFSKYYFFVDEVTISTDEGDKRPDFIFVDTQGNIDVVEIKKSHNISVVSKGKYRNNCTPSKELIGTIMQMEKYLYHLNRTVVNSEKKIKKKLTNKVQVEIDIKIRNPQGIIILGRSNGLNDEELRDYEIIKRQFKHIADIITYDDLINRLDRLLNIFSEK